MSNPSLLIELGTEELPPTALKTLSEAFAHGLLQGLQEAQLVEQPDAKIFATPRRLALLVANVAASQPDQADERRGPAVAAAYKDGKPTPAALGFAKSCGVEVDQLERLKTDKGEWLSYTVKQEGKALADLINGILETAIKRLPIPKRMRWGAGDAEFVRPAHWLVVLHGENIVPASVLDLNSGRETRGHRFHGDKTLMLNQADEYQAKLANNAHVTACFDQRQAEIVKQIEALADQLGAKLDQDQDLLDEVTALVEKPVALLGQFDDDFLQVPSECLISAMRDHQKYFHLRDKEGKLLPNFITISNIESKDAARVIEGNQRVLRARLSDARFFWDTDRKTPLAAQVEKLDAVLFHADLGSLGQKVARLSKLAPIIAEHISANTELTARAALLAKADLVTDMVGEFDKLQGLMGRYYAELDGEPDTVSAAVEQHYWPRYAGDVLPESKEAQALALADRLDSLVGIFTVASAPTGDKDPYSLRRAALGILRILIEQGLELDLAELVKHTADVYLEQGIQVDSDKQAEIVRFALGRLTAYYQAQDVSTNAINAVAACAPSKPLEFHQRLQAVRSFNQLEEAADLSAANKRIGNILKKQETAIAESVDSKLFAEQQEQSLFEALQQVQQTATNLFDAGDYAQGLKALAVLRNPVDDFFENVMVMSDDPSLQNNRLALLKQLQSLFLRVADIAQLQG